MVGKKHPRECSFRLLWLRKLEKAMEKDLERKSGISWHFIYENNGNWEKRKVKGQRLHARRKIKENNGK